MPKIFYQVKSAKKDTVPDVFLYEGAASVFDIKQEIVKIKKPGDSDLSIYNMADEEYTDDNEIVPRDSIIKWKRTPPSRPGKGTALQYLQDAQAPEMRSQATGGMGMHRGGHDGRPLGARRGNMILDTRAQHRSAAEQPPQQPPNTDDSPAPAPDSEEAGIQAMFQQSTDQWNREQDKLAGQRYIPYISRGSNDARRGRGGYQGGGGQMRDSPAGSGDQIRVPPDTYVCYRCGQKGHYINQCPTNGDQTYDKPRIKRTTGIPNSFLKKVSSDAVASGKGGLMVTPNGDLVVAQDDSTMWEQHTKSVQNSHGMGTLDDLLDLYGKEIPVPESVQCPVCKGISRFATITPCCGTTFCESCINDYMIDNDLQCYECKQRMDQGVDDLIPNLNVQAFIDKYVRDYAKREEQSQ